MPLLPYLTSQLRSSFRPSYTKLNGVVYNNTRRALFHDRKADFVTIDKTNGSHLTRRKLDIFIGEPQNAYVMIDPDVGFAMRSAIAEQVGPSPLVAADQEEKVPLTFYHGSRYFAHEKAPYPRILIEQDLPRQDASSSNTSPATLWLWGAMHCITLDGTPDYDFVESSRESHERLKGVAEILKDS